MKESEQNKFCEYHDHDECDCLTYCKNNKPEPADEPKEQPEQSDNEWVNAYKRLPEIGEDGESELVLCAGRKGTHRNDPDCYVRYEIMKYMKLDNPISKNSKGEWIEYGWSNRWWNTNPDVYDVEYWMSLPKLPSHYQNYRIMEQKKVEHTRDQLIDMIANITDKHYDPETDSFYRINCASEILTFLKGIGMNIPEYNEEQKKVESSNVPKESKDWDVYTPLDEIKDLKKELADLQAERDRYLAANNILLDGDHEASMANEINKLQIQNRDLRAKNIELVDVGASLQKEIADLRVELKEVNTELIKWKASIEVEREDWQNEREHINSQKESLCAERDKILNEGNFWYTKTEELKAELDKLKEDKLHLEILAEGRLQYNKQLEAERHELKEWKKEAEKTIIELSKAIATYDELNADNERLKEKIIELENKIEHLEYGEDNI